MAAGSQVWINGRDVAGFGFSVEQASGVRDAAIARPADSVMGRVGTTLLGGDRTETEREIRVTGTFDAPTPSMLASAMRDLVAWIGGGTVELITAHDLRVVYQVELRGVSQAPAPGQFVNAWQRAELVFLARAPRAFDRAVYAYAIPAGMRVMIPVGSEVCAPQILAWGFSSPLIVTRRRHNGEVLATMQVSWPGLGANDFLVIDCHERAMWQSLAGTRVLAQSLIDDAFLVLDPRGGARELGLWESLECSSGTALVRVRPVHRVT